MKNYSKLMTPFPFALLILMAASCQSTGLSEVVDKEEVQKIAQDTTPRVTGIGGIFFYAEQPGQLNAWYGEQLGIALDDYGAVFEFRNGEHPEEINYLRWASFPAKSDYFQPSAQPFMINYRVRHLERLVERLKASGAVVLDTIAYYDYGKFVHLLDPEGNKLELWEPVDSVLTKLGTVTNK